MSKHIVIIAGEESGDQHAASLLKNVLHKWPDLKVSGMGGAHLESLGMQNLMDFSRLSITGLSGVFEHIFSILKAFSLIKKHLLNIKPDLVILVDCPGFNLRMTPWIKKYVGCPVLYYISPQLWAWKPKRMKIIQRYVDHMAVILPFEKKIYQQASVPVSYVGHPLIDSLQNLPSPHLCRNQFGWKEKQFILALLPGSRTQEWHKHMPVLIKTLQLLKDKPEFSNIKLVMPVALSLKPSLIQHYLSQIDLEIEVINGQALQVMQAADAVIVASGTASLEAALLTKPSCIIYKSGWLTYFLALKLIRVRYLGLSNLLCNKMIIPELIQSDCNPFELSKMISKLIQSKEWRLNMTNRLCHLKDFMNTSIDIPLEDIVFKFLSKTS